MASGTVRDTTRRPRKATLHRRHGAVGSLGQSFTEISSRSFILSVARIVPPIVLVLLAIVMTILPERSAFRLGATHPTILIGEDPIVRLVTISLTVVGEL